MTSENSKLKVFAYGFDKYGFLTPAGPKEYDEFFVEYIDLAADRSLEDADGLVIPSGIFEEHYQVNGPYRSKETRIRHDVNQLAVREKQLFNSYKAGKWVVFLLGAIENGEQLEYSETDLAKKYLNVFASEVRSHAPNGYITCKADEFREYLDRFGLACTSFRGKISKSPGKVLAHLDNSLVGLEVRGSVFFLPFFTNKRDMHEVCDAVCCVTESVFEYKRKNDIYLPPWVLALEFNAEARIKSEELAIQKRLIELGEQAEQWKRYKSVLCTSGKNLVSVTISILREFFDLKLNSEEKFIEDAIIYSPSGEVAYVVEIKGVNGGLKREHVNQIDSHRERLGFGPEIPGLLILNDFMDTDDLAARKSKDFDAQHLARAKGHNIRILRTVTLFDFMLAQEAFDNRSSAFLQLCEKGNPLVQIPLR